jgi:hypothetical protein
VLPHPNEWLVELAPFTVPTRQLTRAGTAREDILAAVSGLVDERGEFTVAALLRQLNPTHDRRRKYAVERALHRMFTGRSRAPELERVRVGRYRLWGR